MVATSHGRSNPSKTPVVVFNDGRTPRRRLSLFFNDGPPVRDAFRCFLISKASLRREDLDLRFLLPEGRPALALRFRTVFVG